MRSVQTFALAALSCLALAARLHAQAVLVEHLGTCDASAAVEVGPGLFVVANDEDNVLRIYSSDKSGPPIDSVDLNPFLKPDPGSPEADIEAATHVGDRIYWITSHGANKNGKERLSRRRLFATDMKRLGGKVTLTPALQPYSDLVKNLAETPALKDFDLEGASKKAPEGEGGLNIEGLAATPQGTLLIAFRNPVPAGKALIVPLENPEQVLAGTPAKLGTPLLLSLDGRGIRSIEYSKDRNEYLIVAGPTAETGTFALYGWAGPPSESPRLIKVLGLSGVRPEALILIASEKDSVLLLSDDGSKSVDDKECKEAETAKRSFRSFRVELDKSGK
jgi:hypothetical protein